ncbi:MAG: hypothetical protein KKH98_04915 [Spirochaetes bacterium]|nr:hypothetical protein [Spirochaetota bacterium]
MKKIILIIILFFSMKILYSSVLMDFPHYNSRLYGTGESLLMEKSDLNNIDIFPASLGGIEEPAISMGYIKWSDLLTIMRAAYAQPLGGLGTISGALSYGSLKDVDNYDNYGNLLGNVKNSDILLNIGYGNSIGDVIYFGLNLKYLSMRISEYSKNWLGGGIAVLVPLRLNGVNVDHGRNLNIGAGLQNFSFKKLDGEGLSYPVSAYAGLVYKFLQIERIGFKLGTTYTYMTEYEKNYLSAGFEMNYDDMLFIRNGYYILKRDIDKMAFGIGVRGDERIKGDFIKGTVLELDYSLSLLDEGISHFIGLNILFSKKNRYSKGREDKDGISLNMIDEEEDRYIYITEEEGSLLGPEGKTITPAGEDVLDDVMDVLEDREYRRIFILLNKDSVKRVAHQKTLTQYFLTKGVKRAQMIFRRQKVRIPVVKRAHEEMIKRSSYQIMIAGWRKGEKEKYDSYYYNGLDAYMKEGYAIAVQQWNEALAVDPENEELVKKIADAKKASDSKGVKSKKVSASIDIPKGIKVKKMKAVTAVILTYKNRGESGKWDLLSRTIPDSVGSSLNNHDLITVTGRNKLEEYIKEVKVKEEDIDNKGNIRDVENKLKANILIKGSFIEIGRKLEIRTEIIDTGTGDTLSTIKVTGEIGANMFDYMDKTVESIVKALWYYLE